MLRIVSLIASATETVHALGLGEFQVGRSHECDHPEGIKNLPICTAPSFSTGGSSADIDRLVKEKLRSEASVYEVHPHVLNELRPTHIITQTHCDVCAVSLDDIERALASTIITRPQVVAMHPNSVHDIWEDIRRIANACDAPQLGEQLVSDLCTRVERISQRASATLARPRVAVIEWQEPLMAAGNWIPELVQLAGGDNVFGTAQRHSPWLDWENLRAANPDVIVVSPCGYDLPRTRQEMYWLTERSGWNDLAAVRAGRVYLADGNRFMNRPGPRIVESLQIFAEILHPEQFDATLHPDAWEPWGG